MKRVGWFLAVLVILGLAAGCGGGKKTVLIGLVDATEIDVASKVPGRVEDLKVTEGDQVKEGQELATISRETIAAKLDQVNAVIDAAKAQFKMANKGAREEQKRAAARQLDMARAQMDVMKKMYDRLTVLLEKKAIPKAQFDEIDAKYQAAAAQYEMARAQNDAVQKGARDEEKEALGALVRQAEGVRTEVESYDKESIQVAPLDGEVSKIVLHKGELAATGFPILTIVDLKDMWITFSVREDLLKKIQKGQKIAVDVPALGQKVELEIFHLAPLADFATWRATQERNSFDLKSFEVRARPVTAIAGLRPGMTVRWTVE